MSVDSPDGSRLTVLLPHGPAAASTRVRVYEWLRRTQIAAEIHTFSDARDNRFGTLIRKPRSTLAAELRTRLLSRGRFDRVFIHREVSPFSAGGLTESVARRALFSIYDFDDALMWSSPSIARPWDMFKATNCIRSVEVVDRVLAGSELLAEWAASKNRDVRLIPTCLDPDDYVSKRQFEIQHPPRIVWIGTPSTEVYLRWVADPLLAVGAATGARLTVISAGGASLGELDSMVDRVEWYPGVEEGLSEFDAAIAPLEDTLWARGKCAFKVLQYAAAGLPTVVSPVGANRTAAGRLGMATASRPREWRDHLIDLLNAPSSERAALGRRGREGVDAHYSYRRWHADWRRAVLE